MKISYIIYAALAIFIIFVLCLYEALRTKKTIVSNKSPFVEIIGKRLTIKRDAFLAKNLEEFAYEEIYYLSEDRKNIFEGVKIVTELKAGTEIVLKSATMHKNVVSGISRCNLVGSVFVNSLKKEMRFEYDGNDYLLDEESKQKLEVPEMLFQEK